jgi:hypothetical protein
MNGNISKELIQSDLEQLWATYSEDQKKLISDTIFKTGLKVYPEYKFLREGQSFLFSLSQIVSVTIPTPNLYYCEDIELVSECLGEFLEMMFERYEMEGM